MMITAKDWNCSDYYQHDSYVLLEQSQQEILGIIELAWAPSLEKFKTLEKITRDLYTHIPIIFDVDKILLLYNGWTRDSKRLQLIVLQQSIPYNGGKGIYMNEMYVEYFIQS